MTSQTINGNATGKTVPEWPGWQRIQLGGIPATTQSTPAPTIEEPAVAPPAEPPIDLVKAAEAAAIRARTDAETEARLITAQAEADAIRIGAEQKNERDRIANERSRMRLEKEQADHALRLEETNRKREAIERERAAANAAHQAEEDAETERAKEIATADDKWRNYAIRFAFVCGIVSLPVQMSFFWNPRAPWMAAAPIMLEGAAWVVHRGARAAVANRRPVWHYRLIVWLLAFVAAGINLYHGLHAFDPGTALATAFASVAGPGVWDLHEHGRIRKRDGVLTRGERKAKERAEGRAAAERAAREAAVKAEKEAAEKAAREAAEQLANSRAERFEDEWDHALEVAAAVGETSVTEAVWRRAWRDIHGTEPGDTVDIIRGRNAAARRLAAASSEAPGNTPRSVASAQRADQMPRAQRGPARKPPVRRPGDTVPYSPAARRAASITAKNAARNAHGEDA